MSPIPTLPPAIRHPWEATWWVKFFEQLGPDFPSPDASESEWKHFVVSCIPAPAILLALGVAVAFGVLCCACSCGRSQDRRRAARRSSVPTILMGLLALLLIVLGTIIYWQTGSKAAQTAQDQLNRAYGDITTARRQGVTLQTLGADILSDLDAIVPACPDTAKPLAQQLVAPVQDQVQEYKTEVDHFVSTIQPVPGKLAEVKDKEYDATRVIAVGLLVPMALVLISCFAVMLAVMLTRTGRCAGFCVCFLGPLLLVPTVLVVTVAASVQMQVGVVAGSFCSNVDSNAVAYIGHAVGNQSVVYELSKYYILGQGNNTLMQDLNSASKQLDSIQTQAQQFGSQIVQFCPKWDRLANLTSSLQQAQDSISSGRALLAPSNIYPYYDEAVREDACKILIVGLGWLVLFQFIVGLICLPLVTCFATKYMKARLTIYREEHRQDRLIAA